MYAVEDFGCEVDFSEIAHGGIAKIVSSPINSPEDWVKIEALPLTAKALSRELYSLELLLEKLRDEEVPVLFTVFSPMTIADKLSGNKLVEHFKEGAGELIREALTSIAQTTANLARRAVEMGAAGIFFASQMSNHSIIEEELYREYGVPSDIEVLRASGGWFDTLHAHGNSIMFKLLKDYPVAVFNWHVGESLPELKEGSLLTGKCVMGGLERMDITRRDKNALRSQICNCFKQLGGQRHILTPGCVIRHPLDDDILQFLRREKDKIEQKFRYRSG
jgi:uroporphyrinogen decarboxylase